MRERREESIEQGKEALAKRLRDRIERDVLTPETAALAEFLGSWRPLVKHALSSYQRRMRFWEGVLDSRIPELLERHEDGERHSEADIEADRAESCEGNLNAPDHVQNQPHAASSGRERSRARRCRGSRSIKMALLEDRKPHQA